MESYSERCTSIETIAPGRMKRSSIWGHSPFAEACSTWRTMSRAICDGVLASLRVADHDVAVAVDPQDHAAGVGRPELARRQTAAGCGGVDGLGGRRGAGQVATAVAGIAVPEDRHAGSSFEWQATSISARSPRTALPRSRGCRLESLAVANAVAASPTVPATTNASRVPPTWTSVPESSAPNGREADEREQVERDEPASEMIGRRELDEGVRVRGEQRERGTDADEEDAREAASWTGASASRSTLKPSAPILNAPERRPRE